MERVKSVRIFFLIEKAVDSHDIPVVFYMSVAERDLSNIERKCCLINLML